MTSSQPSRLDADLLSDVLRALETRANRGAWLEAAGDWSLAFPALDRLKFVAVLRGACWLLPTGTPARRLSEGDVCLIGRTGYVVASDPALPPTDGMALHATSGDRLRLGGDEALLLGGGVSFAPGTADFLLDMLPTVLVVDRSTAGAVAAILALLDREAREPGLGSRAASDRLAGLLVVEAIRSQVTTSRTAGTGWLGALADPRVGRALRAFHADIARPWTVAALAGQAGMSRAAFSAAFTGLVGEPPLAYARRWRLTIARARLAAGAPVARVASEVGYASPSAFTHAYGRHRGFSPRAETRDAVD